MPAKSILPPILVVDDDPEIQQHIRNFLGNHSYEVVAVGNGEQAAAHLKKQNFFLVLSDWQMEGITGFELLQCVHAKWPETEFVMVTAHATTDRVVEALRSGASGYLSKPYDPDRLLFEVQRCEKAYRLKEQIAALRAKTLPNDPLSLIVGRSPQTVYLRNVIKTVADAEKSTVLILGESGTGKELVAGALHSLGPRREENHVRINCAAIPENLLESELFGHVKGAFTGAIREKPGRVEEADGGTIFLDEIGDMSAPLQAKLLRFLEDGTFSRLGNNDERRVDVRVIAATNKDLSTAMTRRKFQFRDDLYHRLNVVQLTIPPLRDRGEDKLLLADHFLLHFTQIMNKPIRKVSAPAKRKLMDHSWPGNVRELRNAMERAVILETTPEILDTSLPDFRQSISLPNESDEFNLPTDLQEILYPLFSDGKEPTMDVLTRAYQKLLYVRYSGNTTKVASVTGKHRTTISRHRKEKLKTQ